MPGATKQNPYGTRHRADLRPVRRLSQRAAGIDGTGGRASARPLRPVSARLTPKEARTWLRIKDRQLDALVERGELRADREGVSMLDVIALEHRRASGDRSIPTGK